MLIRLSEPKFLKEKSQIDLMNNDEVYCRKLYFKES